MRGIRGEFAEETKDWTEEWTDGVVSCLRGEGAEESEGEGLGPDPGETPPIFGIRLQGLESRVQGLGFCAQRLSCQVEGSQISSCGGELGV